MAPLGFVDIDFNTEENFLVSKIELAETFEEVLVLAKELYTLCKQQLEQENKERQEVENDTGIDLGDETLNGSPKSETEESEKEAEGRLRRWYFLDFLGHGIS